MNYYKHQLIHYFILICTIYFIIFLKLDAFHMRWWDESMFAVNTYEMMESGNYFSLSFNRTPDLFNTKPPLTNWLQLLSVKLLGYNELAIRLPSAMAGCFTILFLFRFISKFFNFYWAWASVLVLLTSAGYIGFHGVRTADSDSVLTLFLLLANFNFIQFIRTDEKKYILYLLLFVTLAFSTKLFAGLLFLPGFLLVLVWFKKLKIFLVNKFFLSGILIMIGISLTLVLIRESECQGYIKTILNNDVGKLVTSSVTKSTSPFYYLDHFFLSRFSFWATLACLGFFMIFLKNAKPAQNSILKIMLVLVISYLVIISFSATKHVWYDMPIYPFLSVFSAYPIILIIKKYSYIASCLYHCNNI